MGMAAPTYYSADMVRALPDDGNRYETVHGELLVTPAPRPPHQVAVTNLIVRLANYPTTNPVGAVLTSPADMSWASDILVQPDVFVVPVEEARAREWTQVRTLLLAVEVLSPSSRRADRFTKRRAYQAHGVPCYWVVDIEGRAVEVWTPETTFPAVERERVVWRPWGAATPLTIPIGEILPPAY
jgi:Uma2 family endonuclease